MVLPQAALTGPLELTKLKRKAINVDISDCDGKVHGDLPPGRGVIKFEPYLQAIKELEIDGVVSIELEYSPTPALLFEWVEEAYRETAPLMKLTGLSGGPRWSWSVAPLARPIGRRPDAGK